MTKRVTTDSAFRREPLLTFPVFGTIPAANRQRRKVDSDVRSSTMKRAISEHFRMNFLSFTRAGSGIGIGIAPVLLICMIGAASPFVAGQADSKPDLARQQEFFELKVRPLLAKNCFRCHTDAKMGGLQLDTRERVLTGGSRGPAVVPGDPDRSLLIKAIIHADSRLEMPPPGKLTSDEISILETWVRDGAVWGAAAGMAAPSASHEYAIGPEQRAFWSFQPVRKSPEPKVKDRSWIRSPIDAFILAKLESRGLRPVKPAAKATLIRRATLDLTGLPPTPAEVDDFVHDKSPNAFAKVVDRLLASPHYGERWGRYWLDVARYSDAQLTAEGDRPMPSAFRYRDWVVEAFNQDLPYDQFVKAQLAGDLLPNRDKLVGGLGFYALSPNPEFHEDRVDATSRGFLGLTVACAQCHDHKYDPIPTKDYYSLLGVFENTKADEFPLAPASVVDKYKEQKKLLDEQKAAFKEFLDNQRAQLVQVFAERSADYLKAVWRVLGPGKKSLEDVVRDDASLDYELLTRWTDFLRPGSKHEHGFLEDWQNLLEKGGTETEAQVVAEKFQSQLRAILTEKADIDKKNAKVQGKNGMSPELLALDRNRYLLIEELSAPPSPRSERKRKNGGLFYFSDAGIARFFTGVWRSHYDSLQARIDKLQSELPPQYPFLPTISDKATPENLRVYIRGDKENLGEEAPRRFLAVLSQGAPAVFKTGSGRLELAEAIASAQNPLTARVMVNRIWGYHFGAGIVRTPGNFGKLGELPTHPELLDYLAARFVENGWSIKKMHREIMLSATYALGSDYSAANYEIDPDNRLLWRASARRLDAEAIRDSLLFVSGKLDLTVGGPGTPIDDDKNLRRTLYGFFSRFKLDPFLRLFDFPDPIATSEQRIATNVPLQQLFYLNSDFVRRQAEALAQRTSAQLPEPGKVQAIYQILFSRAPTQEELQYASEFVSGGPSSWPQYIQVLLSSNEFNYVN
jgi:Protein of unknown function (DUF1553)/Protein of unknown function (DUF1549)/Planctomycete cytochrome C